MVVARQPILVISTHTPAAHLTLSFDYVLSASGQTRTLHGPASRKRVGAASVEHELRAAGSLLGSQSQISLAIDVGGNVGNYTGVIRKVHPGAEVRMFEPSKTNIDILVSLV